MRDCRHHGEYAGLPLLLQGGARSNTFLALKNAGVKDVRMYFGSWNEWSRDPSLPIEEGLPTEAKLTTKAA